jgi:hypothetical protein
VVDGFAERTAMQPTEREPTAHGDFRVSRNPMTTEVEIRIDNIRPATLFGGDYSTYVLWAISPEGNVQNLAEIILHGDESVTRAATVLRSFGIIVTAEPHYLVKHPSPFVVLEATTNRPDRKIQYVVQEGLYNFERSRLTHVKEAKARVYTEVKQAFTAFRLAQRAGADVLASDELRRAENALDQVLTLSRRGVISDEIAALARETVRLAVSAQRLAEDRALSAFESTGKSREEETTGARFARKQWSSSTATSVIDLGGVNQK